MNVGTALPRKVARTPSRSPLRAGRAVVHEERKSAAASSALYLPKPTLPEPSREAPELRAQLEGVAPSLVATLPRLDRIELVGANRYRSTYGDIVICWKVAPDGELTQFIE